MAASPGFPARFHRLLKEIAELLNNPPEHVVCLKPASITQLEEWARTRDAALKCGTKQETAKRLPLEHMCLGFASAEWGTRDATRRR